MRNRDRNDPGSDGGQEESQINGEIESANPASPMPFEGLDAPVPLDSSPPPPARWLAFAGVLVGGLLGGLIGYGVGGILGGTDTWAAFGAFIAGVGCAVGVGIVASLTLRAMNEWNLSVHPEDPRNPKQQRNS